MRALNSTSNFSVRRQEQPAPGPVRSQTGFGLPVAGSAQSQPGQGAGGVSGSERRDAAYESALKVAEEIKSTSFDAWQVDAGSRGMSGSDWAAKFGDRSTIQNQINSTWRVEGYRREDNPPVSPMSRQQANVSAAYSPPTAPATAQFQSSGQYAANPQSERARIRNAWDTSELDRALADAKQKVADRAEIQDGSTRYN